MEFPMEGIPIQKFSKKRRTLYVKGNTMSKMNNNSRKNSKTTKIASKKAMRSKTSSKKNFKMDASGVYGCARP